MMAADEDIRFVTYLSPSMPRAYFEALADHVQRALGSEQVSLRVESRVSGPQKGANGPPLPKKPTWRSCVRPRSSGCVTCDRRPRSCSACCQCSRTKETREACLLLQRRGAQRRSDPRFLRARRRLVGVERCVLIERLL